jgi:hypothetical protein
MPGSRLLGALPLHSRLIAGLVAGVLVAVVAGSALMAGAFGSAGATPTARSSTIAAVSTATPPNQPSVTAPASPSTNPATPDPSPAFPPIQLLVPPTNDPNGTLVPPEFWADPNRPLPPQSAAWLGLKAAGRVALVNGKFAVLAQGTDPTLSPVSGQPVPAKALMDTAWTRWIIEVQGVGRDEKGTSYSNLNYWKFCGDGAMTSALWYWQQRTGHPDVTGMAGTFIEPYVAEGVPWPAKGPRNSKGAQHGTYWSGSDAVNGYAAHGRGFEFYMAMAARPTGWTAPGFSVFSLGGKALYPSLGTPITNIMAGLNWEASGHAADWNEAYYTIVTPQDPTLARDLAVAVTIDVGRDQVPVVAMVDTFDLPNWQNGSKTPHTRHAIAIVGYDNAANPPTFTYTETCGKACDPRPGNHNGSTHTIPQATMVKAIQNQQGSGFVW